MPTVGCFLGLGLFSIAVSKAMACGPRPQILDLLGQVSTDIVSTQQTSLYYAMQSVCGEDFQGNQLRTLYQETTSLSLSASFILGGLVWPTGGPWQSGHLGHLMGNRWGSGIQVR